MQLFWRLVMPAICLEVFDSLRVFKEAHCIHTGSCLPLQDFMICLPLQGFVIIPWSVLKNFTVKTIVWTYGYYLKKKKKKLKIQDQLKRKDLKQQALKYSGIFLMILLWFYVVRADLISVKIMRLFSWLWHVLLLILLIT